MARSQETFNKKEVRNKKEKKKKDKAAKRLEKRGNDKSGDLDDMIAYVDEFGNISDTPPDPLKKKSVVNSETILISIPKKESLEDEDGVRKGNVTFFNHEKGYGFIKDTSTGESVFVHINNVENEDIKENNMVLYEVEMGAKGPTAVNVKLDK